MFHPKKYARRALPISRLSVRFLSFFYIKKIYILGNSTHPLAYLNVPTIAPTLSMPGFFVY